MTDPNWSAVLQVTASLMMAVAASMITWRLKVQRSEILDETEKRYGGIRTLEAKILAKADSRYLSIGESTYREQAAAATSTQATDTVSSRIDSLAATVLIMNNKLDKTTEGLARLNGLLEKNLNPD